MKFAASRPFGQDTAFLVVISNYKEIGKKKRFCQRLHYHPWKSYPPLVGSSIGMTSLEHGAFRFFNVL